MKTLYKKKIIVKFLTKFFEYAIIILRYILFNNFFIMFNKKNTLLLVTSMFVFSSVSAASLPTEVKTATPKTWMETKVENVMSSPLTISSVKVLESNKAEVLFSKWDMNFSTGSELKVYNQVEVAWVKALETDSKKLEIKLAQDTLTTWSSISLLSLNDLDLNADFVIDKDGYVLTSATSEAWSKLTVVDSKTILIDLKKDLVWALPNLKVLKENKVKEVNSQLWKITLTLENSFESNKSYILMVLSLLDSAKKDVALENGVFDFTGPTEVLATAASTGAVLETKESLDLMAATGATATWATASGMTSTGWLAIEDVALKADATPETGTKEIFIVLLSLMLGLGIFAYKNKNAKV